MFALYIIFLFGSIISLSFHRSNRDTSLYSIQNVLNAINNNIIAINSVSNMGLAINKSEVPALTARMAIAVIGIVPMLCIYPFFQKYFVKGITIGAVKG